MIIKHNKKTIELLGDTHLGRSFLHGVPLHRRGDREKMVWAQFEKSLAETKADVHVHVGDLFDKAYVPYDCIVRAAITYLKAATEKPATTFIILRGNHDVLRDLERVSAFDLFTHIVGSQSNIKVVTEKFVLGDVAYFAWQPVVHAADLVAGTTGKICVGHWDVTSFGGNDENLIPTKQLAEAGFTHAYTGHIHRADQFDRDGIDVMVVGSMQPFAHGEESNTDLYITLTKDEIDDTLHDRCVRIILQPDEILDEEIDCLQLTVKKLDGVDEEMPAVVLGDFDMISLFRTAFAEVNPEITETLLQQFNLKRLADGS
ncbi:metallophosphoesterase [Mesorhizobium sp. STM 4661]|uniref:metallophosphoesterase n=1 Tax=Mesorhizobium sp. STM 4661 TaxID=1297570 RepID=UPI0002BF6386|nr:metallophosphoesterase [Mesorhizobium sp. STM 4661]CCV12903.1 hypothetical protein MESS4_510070 [Mesorhizobium sp. STM 4661]